MACIIAIVALSLVMTVLTIAELRRPVGTSRVQLPELTFVDQAATLFALGMFAIAIIDGLILVAAEGLP
jgi:hypothetical protein